MFAATRASDLPTDQAEHAPATMNYGLVIMSAALAAVLLLSLVHLPHAEAMSNHTWRVEFAAGVFLLACSLATRDVRYGLNSALSRRAALVICLFILWSLVSATWAASLASAVHHTIVWCEYALFFALVSEILRLRGRSFLQRTFVWYVCVIGAVTVFDYATMTSFKEVEATLRGRYSAYGELSLAILPLLWLSAAYQRRLSGQILALLPAVLGWMSAMLSLSKGVFLAGIVGFIFAFVASLVFGKRIHRRRVLVTAAIWISFTVAVQVGSSLIAPIPATVDYISGKADATRETTTARIFVWRTTVPLLRANWLKGVGADNYGIKANEGRAAFRATHPDDPPDEPISDFLWERSHNEPLQVLLELGVPGLLLFAAPFVLFAIAAIRSVMIRKERPSIFFWAACGGMIAFAASSMVSSFSFRIVQNGIAFFVVFAMGVYELVRAGRRRRVEASITRLPRTAVVSVLLIAIAVLSLKAAAEYDFFVGDQDPNRAEAREYYSRAHLMDPDYAAADYRLSRVAYDQNDYQLSARKMRQAIDGGLGVVFTYSNLAECYEKGGDRSGEFGAFSDAFRIYPRSVFLRVRYSVELEKSGRQDAADQQLAIAREIDTPQANGWYSIITRGSVRTFYDSRANADIAAPDDLKPAVAVQQYLDKDGGE